AGRRGDEGARVIYIFVDQLRTWLLENGLYRPFFSLFDYIEFRALAATGIAFLIVILLGRPTIRTLMRLKIGDTGETDAEALRRHNQSKANTPTMGGVLIAGAILIASLLLADLRTPIVFLGLIVVVWMAVLGGVDDYMKLTASRRGNGRQGLYAWEKLIFQIGLGLIVGWFSFRVTDGPQDLRRALNLPLQKTYVRADATPLEGLEADGVTPTEDLGGGVLFAPDRVNPGVLFLPMPLFVIVSILMIAGMSNAVNITDGMDGLATGIAGVVSLGIVVVALLAGYDAAAHYLLIPHVEGAGEMGVMAAAMAGACLGFLWWNCSPAKVFMGDTGSLCLGGLIGYFAVATRQEFVVLVMSLVFLVEIGSVVIQVGVFKATGGKRVFRCAPIHHHFHLLGWTEQQVVARFWIVSILLLVLGLASIKVR
ncbi:MAG: phospho-N-acetylmuramoyl-pentapeptide-transferase, partial [Phycisphaerales bacterium]|nr:phospho-N-acetylmuramoyl-pentapeptide-transferase [Phycisphaerales bacterium]